MSEFRNKVVDATFLTLLFGAVAGDQPNQTATYEVPAVSYEEAAADAVAVARRYDNCEITSQPRTVGSFIDRSSGRAVLRDAIQFDIETERNERGIIAERRWAEDDRVMWNSGLEGYRVGPDESGKLTLLEDIQNVAPADYDSSRTEEPQSTVKLYPKQGYPKGSRVDVYVTTHTETIADLGNGLETRVTRASFGKFCGSLIADGAKGWSVDTTTTPLQEQAGKVTECKVETFPDRPNVGYVNC